MTTASSDIFYAIYHPEHLIDVLRAGAYFPANQVFKLPPQGSNQQKIRSFITTSFPVLSEERHEIWLRFRSGKTDRNSYAIEDIESAHFFSSFREDAAPPEIISALESYHIPIKAPIGEIATELVNVYDSMIREHVSRTIIRAWFGPDLQVSPEFLDQLRIGYAHQQSSSPDKLEPIPSDKIWARMISYNPGLRKFEERPNVLPLQDIQEVLKRTDQEFRDKLKVISEKYDTKFPDVIQNAETHYGKGLVLSKWLAQERAKPDSYLYDLDKFLSFSANQESFLYCAILYLFWRQEVLNKDYSGQLVDNPVVKTYLINSIGNPLKQSVAEALFTIIYAGGPRVFQKALIEARLKILNINQEEGISKPGEKTLVPVQKEDSFNSDRSKLIAFPSMIISYIKTIFNQADKEKKKHYQKEVKKIGLAITKLKAEDLDEIKYRRLCVIFGVVPQELDKSGEAVGGSIKLPKVIKQELNFSSEELNDRHDSSTKTVGDLKQEVSSQSSDS